MTDNLNDGTALYDPTADGETIDKVRDYMKSASADEVGRVKALEEGGQKRKGILDWEPEKAKTPKDGDGYIRVLVEDPYPAGTPAAWGHNAQDEGQPGSDTPVESPEDTEG